MVGAVLDAVILDGTFIEAADLTNAILTRLYARGADFSYSRLVGADLSGATLERASFIHSDLAVAKLVGADLDASDFRNARLIFAILDGAKGKVRVNSETKLFGISTEGADIAFLTPDEFESKSESESDSDGEDYDE